MTLTHSSTPRGTSLNKRVGSVDLGDSLWSFKRRGWDSNPRTGGTCQRFSRPSRSSRKPEPEQDLRQPAPCVAHHLPTDTCKTDPDLAAVVAAWPNLPEAIKAGIVAMVKAAST